MLGELIPIGGGDTIPLLKNSLLVGRRESCDIVLRFSNVSAHHCQLLLVDGYWYVKDEDSRNGVKVNGHKVTGKKRIDPGDELAVARHKYKMQYSPMDVGAVGPPPPEEANAEDLMRRSLLERAGLNGKRIVPRATEKKRIDILDNDAKLLPDRSRPT